MTPARFVASSLHEALEQIRESLGPDAEIVSTRRRSRLFGLLPGPVEVEARALARLDGQTESLALLQALAQQVARLGEAVEGLRVRPEEAPCSPLGRLLEQAEVPARLGGELLWETARRALAPTPRALDTREEHLQALAEVVSRRLGSCAAMDPQLSSRPYLCLFVGPTGVGKTTTMAKLAAHFAFERRLAVGLLTMDTFRVAAVEQMRVFAGLARLPLRVVETPGQATRALHALRHCRLILVDTAGRSPGHAAHLEEIRLLARQIKPDECHLVLEASTRESDLRRIVARFGSIGCNRLTVTKLDETESFGGLLAMAEQPGLAFSYLTFGQRVPEDICPANVGLLTSLVLRGVRAAPWLEERPR